MLEIRVVKGLTLALVTGLAGCSSSPISRVATAEQHEKYVSAVYQVGSCSSSGRMPLDIAGFANNDLAEWAAKYSMDSQVLAMYEAQVRKKWPMFSTEDCNQVSVYWSALMQKSQQTPAPAAYMPPMNRHTYCNKIGTQVFCNTF